MCGQTPFYVQSPPQLTEDNNAALEHLQNRLRLEVVTRMMIIIRPNGYDDAKQKV